MFQFCLLKQMIDKINEEFKKVLINKIPLEIEKGVKMYLIV